MWKVKKKKRSKTGQKNDPKTWDHHSSQTWNMALIRILEKTDWKKALSDCKRLGGNRHWGFSLHSKVCTKARRFPCYNSKVFTTADPKQQLDGSAVCLEEEEWSLQLSMAVTWWCYGASLYPLALKTCSVWKERFIEVSGTPRRKHHAVCEKTEAWAPLVLPGHQSPDFTTTENLWWDLKKAVAECISKNITKLEAIAHEE